MRHIILALSISHTCLIFSRPARLEIRHQLPQPVNLLVGPPPDDELHGGLLELTNGAMPQNPRVVAVRVESGCRGGHAGFEAVGASVGAGGARAIELCVRQWVTSLELYKITHRMSINK